MIQAIFFEVCFNNQNIGVFQTMYLHKYVMYICLKISNYGIVNNSFFARLIETSISKA